MGEVVYMSSIFQEKFSEWHAAMGSCNALRKTHSGPWFCMYTGNICSFVHCPRRLYEGELSSDRYVPIDKQLKEMRAQIGAISLSLRGIYAKLAELNRPKVGDTNEAQNVEG